MNNIFPSILQNYSYAIEPECKDGKCKLNVSNLEHIILKGEKLKDKNGIIVTQIFNFKIGDNIIFILTPKSIVFIEIKDGKSGRISYIVEKLNNTQSICKDIVQDCNDECNNYKPFFYLILKNSLPKGGNVELLKNENSINFYGKKCYIKSLKCGYTLTKNDLI